MFEGDAPPSLLHRNHKKLLKRYYYLARVIVAFFIVLFTTIVPPFDRSHLTSQASQSTLASALLRWDAFHFSQIALEGYTYEYQFAFFPGIPAVMRVFGEGGLRLANALGLTSRAAVKQSDVLLGGSLAAFLLCDWTGDLYDLTLDITSSPSTALLTTILSLVPLSPPTILFAAYAEPFFATLSYKGMLACQRKQWVKGAVAFTLAGFFRSNGVLLSGFLIWGLVVEPIIRQLAAHSRTTLSPLFRNLSLALLLTSLTFIPFLLHRHHASLLFCTPTTPTSLFDRRPWCDSHPYAMYSFVQRQYWDVGFLRYWSLSQIPNFLFAAPPLALLFYSTLSQIIATSRKAGVVWKSTSTTSAPTSLKIQEVARSLVSLPTSQKTESSPSSPKTDFSSSPLPPIPFHTPSTLPHAIHTFLLSCILLFASHVQIVLRLSSSMPYFYWAAAGLIIKEDGKWGRRWVLYLCVWSMVSMVLWAAFLPPA